MDFLTYKFIAEQRKSIYSKENVEDPEENEDRIGQSKEYKTSDLGIKDQEEVLNRKYENISSGKILQFFLN